VRSPLNTPFGLPPLTYAALVAAAIGAVVFVVNARILITSTTLPSSAPSLGEDGKKALDEHAASTADRVAQIKGRSPFFVPSAPPRKVVTKPRDPEPPRPPPAPSKPSSYGGPAIFAIVNDVVWFADGKKLATGEGDEKSVKVVKLNPPWSATVAYQGVEFDVSLFDRDKLIYPTPGDSKHVDAKPVDAKPADTKPADPKPAESTPTDSKTPGPKPEDPPTVDRPKGDATPPAPPANPKTQGTPSSDPQPSSAPVK